LKIGAKGPGLYTAAFPEQLPIAQKQHQTPANFSSRLRRNVNSFQRVERRRLVFAKALFLRIFRQNGPALRACDFYSSSEGLCRLDYR